MEIIQVIIGLAVFVFILIVKSKSQTLKNNKDHPSQENFPFPKIPENRDSIDEWLGRTPSNEVVENKKQTAKVETIGGKMAVSSFQSKVNLANKEPQEIEPFEFDAEKAIIYSEIMNAKYKEY